MCLLRVTARHAGTECGRIARSRARSTRRRHARDDGRRAGCRTRSTCRRRRVRQNSRACAAFRRPTPHAVCMDSHRLCWLERWRRRALCRRRRGLPDRAVLLDEASAVRDDRARWSPSVDAREPPVARKPPRRSRRAADPYTSARASCCGGSRRSPDCAHARPRGDAGACAASSGEAAAAACVQARQARGRRAERSLYGLPRSAATAEACRAARRSRPPAAAARCTPGAGGS